MSLCSLCSNEAVWKFFWNEGDFYSLCANCAKPIRVCEHCGYYDESVRDAQCHLDKIPSRVDSPNGHWCSHWCLGSSTKAMEKLLRPTSNLATYMKKIRNNVAKDIGEENPDRIQVRPCELKDVRDLSNTDFLVQVSCWSVQVRIIARGHEFISRDRYLMRVLRTAAAYRDDDAE